MRFQDFKNRVRDYPVITPTLLRLLGENERVLHNQLSRWTKQGLLIQLMKGMYLLSAQDRALRPSRFFLANQLVFPSYVSLESALSFYHLIPEGVPQVTSATTAKPARYFSSEGTFAFRHLKKSLLFGFQTMKDEAGFEFMIAEPEKALLDFIYLNLSQFLPMDDDVFTESYRFSGLGDLHRNRLIEYAARFESKKLLRVVDLLVHNAAFEPQPSDLIIEN